MRMFLLFSLLLGFSSLLVAEEGGVQLSHYKWKNRVIVAYPEGEAEWKELQDSLKREQHGIAERDLIIIDWSMLSDADKELLKAKGLKKGVYLLLGKDGGVKAKQKGKLDFAKWFALIDSMPMRKQEMSGK